MGNRYLVVSDVHLAEVEDHADGWMAHKASRFLFDDDFAELLQGFVARSEQGDALTLVLNGDIFDFDLVTAVPADPPWPVGPVERRYGLRADEPKSAWKLERIVAHHPVFLTALAEFARGGHRIVYVLGNHDRELHFPGVQQVLEKALAERGAPAGAMRFEPWFFYAPGELYAEHGQQYDHYSSYRYLLWPVVRQGKDEVLAVSMGNLSNRLLMTKMGFFNPHASNYILNVYAYLAHWLRHYALTRRSLALNWFFGSLLVIFFMFRMRRDLHAAPPEHAARLARYAGERGLRPAAIRALARLQRKPILNRMYRLIRELWIDRALIAVAMTTTTVGIWASPAPLLAKILVPLSTFPLLYFLYEMLAEGETIFTIEKTLPKLARVISRILPARVVTFGHTHKPRQIPLSREATFVDTGTWAPVLFPESPDRLVPGLRTFLEVAFEQGEPRITFASYMPACPGVKEKPSGTEALNDRSAVGPRGTRPERGTTGSGRAG